LSALARGFAMVISVVAAWIVVATALIDGAPAGEPG
jgi:hypothetical protein